MWARGGVQVFSPTLLVEGRDDQLKYGSCLHSSKLYVWGEKESSWALLYMRPTGLYSSRCCAATVVYSIPIVGMHRRLGEQVSETVVFSDPAPGEGE